MFIHRQLLPEDDVRSFACGTESLDAWLQDAAQRSHRQGIVRVHVWVDQSAPDRVVAYSAIQPTQLSATDLSRGQSGGHTAVPGYLIARLAQNRSLHGTGLGSELLVTTLEICVEASRVGGGRIIVVDPVDDAARGFYEHHDFLPTKGGTDRLVMKVATAAAALGD